ncbi:MAG: hypothetical protein LBH00_02730 [Planctomycetaceae bacterium]|jgi:hypothetical protein|nr:hypothetical protein [Planctomycetaceae bacterium]
MDKRTYKTGLELTGKQWHKLKKFFSEPQRSPFGGQVPVSCVCPECLIRLLQSGTRDKDIPKHCPSGNAGWSQVAAVQTAV